MWESQGCLESDIQRNVISRCGLVEYHDIGTCEMQARAEGTGSISINAIRQCDQTLLLLWGCKMHVLAKLHLKRFIRIWLKVVA